MPRLSVIVPATDGPVTLAACRSAIAAAVEGPDELLVVEAPAGGGPAQARNRAALQATGDVLVFVDADVLVRPDAFARIRRAFAEDPGLTAVFGSYDDAPAAPGLVSAFRNLLHHHTHQRAGGPATTFWAGLGAIRRDAFLAVGGFDGGVYDAPAVEDIDLGLRLTATGARIELDPALQGTHLKAWTLRRMLMTDVRRRGAPWVALLARRGRSSTALNLGWRNRLSAIAVAAVPVVALLAPLLLVAHFAVLLALNASLYALLWRRLGPARGLLGVGLHVLHLAAAVLAVPLGLAAALGARPATALPPLLEPAVERS